MTRKMRRALAAILVMFGAVSYHQQTAAQAPAARPRYRIIDLGTLGGTFSRALSINNRGEVSGESLLADDGDVAAFYWGSGGMRQLTSYDPQAVGSSAGRAINDSGVVVGYWDPSSFPNTPPSQIFRYDVRTGTLEFLGEGFGEDINSAGQILARGPGGRDFIIGGVDLDAAFGGSGVNAQAINAAGEVAVVGTVVGQGAYVYRNGQFVPVPGGIFASELNDVGQVAGSYIVDLGLFGIHNRAAMRERDGTVRTFNSMHSLGDTIPNAINNHGQIVGSEHTIVSNRRVSTAFIIDKGVTRPLSDFLPPGSPWQLSGRFGEAHDINDRGEIVGTGLINGEWHAFLMTPLICSAAEDIDADGHGDDDGDALCDSWEVEGVDGDEDGRIDLFLGTSHERKDLFVEIDYMVCAPTNGNCDGLHSHRPRDQALPAVVAAFANADVVNPDLSFGITLHLQVDDAVPEIPEIAFLGADRPGGLDDFNDLKRGSPAVACGASATGFFGTVLDRAHADCEAILKARELVFRYAIFGHSHVHDVRASGIAEIGGNDFMVTLGAWNDAAIRRGGGSMDLSTARAEVEGATFMHEFGHTLGLRHGGGDDMNCKPNYLSVMNYTFQTRELVRQRPLNFSFPGLPTLDETALDETAGVGGAAGQFTVAYSAFPPPSGRPVVYAADGPIDWNQDRLEDTNVARNVNFLPQKGPSCRIDTMTFLTSFDDWDSLQYGFYGSPDFADGTVRSTVSLDPEQTEDDVLNTAQSIDLDEDAITDFPDNCPDVPNPGQEDADGNGIGNACEPRPPDTTPPTLTLPSSMTVDATNASGATVDFTATATDNVDGPVPVTCAPSSGSSFALGTTQVTCSASDAAGNASSGSFAITVVSRPSAGRMFGLGFTNDAPVRYVFAFVVEETAAGQEGGWFSLLAERPASGRGFHLPRIDRFIATTITAVTFADDPSYRPGKSAGLNVDTVSFSGIGTWNGKKGYRFEARASDRGEPGRHGDTLEIVVTAPSGTVVARVDGPIAGGNIQSSR